MIKRRYCLLTAVHLLLFAVITVLLLSAVGYQNPGPDVQSVQYIRHVTVQTGSGEPVSMTLPLRLSDLPPRTPVTVTATIYPDPEEEIYVESRYCPGKVYLNGLLGYEFGREGQAPAFMLDPAPEVHMIETRGTGRAMELRMEFLSPRTQNRMTLVPPMLGTTKAIILNRFRADGATCVLAAAQAFYGVFLLLVFVCIRLIDRKGVSFLWLGLLALSTGLWALGENNFSDVIFKNSTLLYLLSFTGFFSFILPLLQFTRSVVDFEDPRPLQYLELVLGICAIGALLLQLGGILACSSSMNFFYAVLPVSLAFVTWYLFREWAKNHSTSAGRFVFPMGLLTLSTILGTFSYLFSVTYTVSSLTQIGMLGFLVLMGIIAGLAMKDSIHLKDRQKQLEFQRSLMEIQVREQQSHSQLLTQQEQLLSRQRHDLRHHLSVIKALAKRENRELQDYLDTLMESIPSASRKFCENQAVNAILCHYYRICQQKGIDLTLELTVPESCPHVPDTDLCVVFANLLENAVEACDRMESGRRFILLRSRLQYELLAITMDNSFQGALRRDGELFHSSKRDAAGIGLNSVLSVARNSGGSAQFRGEGSVFQSSVLLRL